MKKTLVLSCALLSLATIHASALTFSLAADLDYANTSGYFQIPAGGAVGTSSLQAPTFNDLGIGNQTFFNVLTNLGFRNFDIYGAYQYDRPDGSAILNRNLISHAVFLPAGTNINTNSEFDLYRLGSDYQFHFMQNKWMLAPMFEATILNFDYQFTTPFIASKRSFMQATPRFGVMGEYHFTDQFSLSADAISSIPSLGNLQVYNLDANANYKFLQRATTSLTAYLGIGYQQIKFEDSQTLPNDIRLNMEPLGRIGLKAKFS